MRTDQQIFLFELLMSDTEKGFLQALHEKSDDEATRNAYADFMEENGRHLSAKLIKDGHVPGGWSIGLPNSVIGSGSNFGSISGVSFHPEHLINAQREVVTYRDPKVITSGG